MNKSTGYAAWFLAAFSLLWAGAVVARADDGGAPDPQKVQRCRLAQEKADEFDKQWEETKPHDNDAREKHSQEGRPIFKELRAAKYELGIHVMQLETPGAPTSGEIQVRERESRRVADYAKYLQEKGMPEKDRIAILDKLLLEFQNHPGLADVYLVLGDAVAASDPSRAAYCYKKSTNVPIEKGSYRRDFTQQEAWQHLAKLHEGRQKYAEAIEALNSWHIGGYSCGNASEAQEQFKYFWLLRLRAHGEGKEAIYGKLWADLAKDHVPGYLNGTQSHVTYIRELYGKDDQASLRKQVKSAVAALPKVPADGIDKDGSYRDLVQMLREFLDLEEQAHRAKAEELVGLVAGLEKRKDEDYAEDISWFRYFDRAGRLASTRQEVLLAEMLARGESVVGPLTRSLDKRLDPLWMYALGRAGGKEAVNYLSARADRCGDEGRDRRDCFYALLLTGDAKARAKVSQAQKLDKSPVSFAAKEALTLFSEKHE